MIIAAQYSQYFWRTWSHFDIVNPPGRLCQLCIHHHTLAPSRTISWHVEFLLLLSCTDNTLHIQGRLCRRGSCVVAFLCNHLLLLTKTITSLIMSRNFCKGVAWLAPKDPHMDKKYHFPHGKICRFVLYLSEIWVSLIVVNTTTCIYLLVTFYFFACSIIYCISMWQWYLINIV